jgi:hypothetical protein
LTSSTPIKLIDGKKLVFKVDPSTKQPGWTPFNCEYHVFIDQEIGRGSCRICYNALGETNGNVCKMVAKQLITTNIVGKELLHSYPQTQQVYMAVSKYLKQFQDRCASLKDKPLADSIASLRVKLSIGIPASTNYNNERLSN